MIVLLPVSVFIAELLRNELLAFKASPTFRFCPKTFPLAPNVTILLDPPAAVTSLEGAVKTGMLFLVVFAEGCCVCTSTWCVLNMC